MFPNDRTEWTLEYWDAQGQEADRDATFDDESDAKALAAREFGIGEHDWRDGPEPPNRRRASRSAR